MTDLSHTELDKETISKAYARWAPVYDLVFGAVFERGREAAVAAAERIGGRILEVGVGTGMSLPDYSRSSRICGIDISEPMLRKAQERVAELGLSNVEGLWVMDAEHLSFPDASFDVVVAQYVITTVPNPEATLDEFARMLKPGGEIVLVSRVGAEAGLRRALEQWFAPVARKLGWRTEFSFERYARWAERTRGMRLIERRAMPPFGHFSLIRFAKAGAAAAREEKRADTRRDLTAYPTAAAIAAPRDGRPAPSCHIGFIESHSTDECERLEHYGPISRGSASATLGRPSLLSSQPDQSIAPSAERDQLPVRLCDDVQGSGHGGARRLAGGDDQPAGRSFLLRAQGLRRGQPGQPRVQGRDQGRLQSAAQGGADDDLGAVAASALLRSDTVRHLHAARRQASNSCATSR